MAKKGIPTLPVGQYLGKGRYCINYKIGEGGYGSVYLAEDTRLGNRKVAIKELLETSPEGQALFSREATLLASLNHPGLVRVSDFFPDGASYYLVMDYIPGRDLLEIVLDAHNSHELLPVDQALKWTVQICDAVAYLHHQSPPIIHRDIKPSNIRINPSKQAILVDFGIAKIDPRAKTQAFAKAVSIGFSPPEQYGGESSTTTRSDVYSIGATLYCLLTSSLPPDGFIRINDTAALIAPHQYSPTLPPALEAVVLKAMELNVSDRYQDARELLAALQDIRGEQTGLWRASSLTPRTFCPRCSKPYLPGARYCIHCGISFDTAHRCLACQLPNRPGARYCWKCGQPLHTAPVPAPAAEAPAAAAPPTPAHPAGAPAAGLNLPALEQACARSPSDAVLALQLAEAYTCLGRHPQAAPILERLAAADPANPDLQRRLALACLLSDQVSRAAGLIAALQSQAPPGPDLTFLAGLLSYKSGNLTEASKSFQQALQGNPQHALAHYFTGQIYMEKKKWQQAITAFKASAAANPLDPYPHARLGLCYVILAKVPEGLAALSYALQLDPQNELALSLLKDLES